MQKDIFRTLIKEGQEDVENIELVKRPFEFEEEGRMSKWISIYRMTPLPFKHNIASRILKPEFAKFLH